MRGKHLLGTAWALGFLLVMLGFGSRLLGEALPRSLALAAGVLGLVMLAGVAAAAWKSSGA